MKTRYDYNVYVDVWLARVAVTVDHDRLHDPHIDPIEYLCPDSVDDMNMHSHLEELETRLSDLHGAHVPHLEIWCSSRKTAGDVLKLLLQGDVFPQYLGELRKVSLGVMGVGPEIPTTEILAAPSHFALDGVTVALSTAQRVGWLLCNRHNGDRDRYLLQAARAASAVTPAADSQPDAFTLPGAVTGGSAQTEELTGGGKLGDELEQDAGVGEEQLDAGTEKQVAEERRDGEGTRTDGVLDGGRVTLGVES